MEDRKSASESPQLSWNHLKSVFPAVQANGRPSTGSLSPGAWPTRSTLLRTGPPETAGRFISEQRWHCFKRSTCAASNLRIVEFCPMRRTINRADDGAKSSHHGGVRPVLLV